MIGKLLNNMMNATVAGVLAAVALGAAEPKVSSATLLPAPAVEILELTVKPAKPAAQYPLVIDPVLALTDPDTCMRLNLYHEARGETLKSIQAVRAVTLARVASKDFPNTVCDVVWQRNQFEWTQDAILDNEIWDLEGWQRVRQAMQQPAPAWQQNVTYYHSGSKPRWFRRAALVEQDRIGQHIFYRLPN